jgi:hypothetical protein
MRFDQLLNAGFADADEREFGCREEGVDCHQQQYDEHPQQHGCNHGCLILTFQRDKELGRRMAAKLGEPRSRYNLEVNSEVNSYDARRG